MSENKEKKFENCFVRIIRNCTVRHFDTSEIVKVLKKLSNRSFCVYGKKLGAGDTHFDKSLSVSFDLQRKYELVEKEQRKQTYQSYQQSRQELVPAVDQSAKDLDQKLQIALATLPEKSRIVFELSRFQEMKYKDIADTLDLSIKTVEGHMTKALRHLRIELIDYLTVIIFYIIYII